MDTNIQQPQNVGQIFSNSFGLFKRTWIHLIPLTIFWAMVTLLPTVLIYDPRSLFLFVAYFVFSTFVYSGAFYYTAHVNRGENIYLTRSVWVAAQKLPITLAAIVILAILTIIAYGFLIIPGIIVTVWFSMCLPIILMEDAGPLEVFRKSYELTTDNWGRTAMVVFVPLLITTVIGLVITKFFILYKPSILYYERIVGIFVFLANFFYLPWVVALFVLQFEDLRKRKALRVLNPSPADFLESPKSEM